MGRRDANGRPHSHWMVRLLFCLLVAFVFVLVFGFFFVYFCLEVYFRFIVFFSIEGVCFADYKLSLSSISTNFVLSAAF